MATLDFKVGGDLAVDLENLYVFMIDKLIEANINNNPECLDVVEKLLKTLYSAWKDVVENPRADGVPSPKLQPDQYKKWLEESQGKVQKGAKEAAKEDSAPQQKSGQRLKLMA